MCDGRDSASVGEVCALMSALSRIPLKQGFAITGSITSFVRCRPSVGSMKDRGFSACCQGATA